METITNINLFLYSCVLEPGRGSAYRRGRSGRFLTRQTMVDSNNWEQLDILFRQTDLRPPQPTTTALDATNDGRLDKPTSLPHARTMPPAGPTRPCTERASLSSDLNFSTASKNRAVSSVLHRDQTPPDPLPEPYVF